MADSDWFENQRKRKHSDVDHSAATRLRQRPSDSSIDDGSFANTTAQMAGSSHTHFSPTSYHTDGPEAANLGPYTQQTSLFQGAHHFGIDKATFHTTTNINSAPSPGIDPYSILHNAIAIEATHTSKTASYAPKCNPQTRIEITSDIVALVKEGLKPVIWFSGPAGGGKTCIMRKVVERCQREGLWTCSYFFSTRIAALDKVDPFVATIVNQLMTVLPALKSPIINAISNYPTVFRESLDFQVDKLIVEPLIGSGLPPSTTPSQVVIAIDGFDECRNEGERIHLLRILGSLHSRLPTSIMVSIVVASRPELDIRMAFDEPQLRGITQAVLLQSYDGMSDVAIYWHDELEKIRQTHPMKRLIPEDWPVEEILHTLIKNSSGQFILPSIIIKHISNPRYNPVERLKQVLSPPLSSGPNHPLTELDALYTVILHPPEGDFQLMKRILHCIIVMFSAVDTKRRSPSFLDELLQLSPGAVEAAISDLHSVLDVPSNDSGAYCITFHHKTLEDFLLSSDRAKGLYQAPHETHADLTLACTRHLKIWAMNPLVRYGRLRDVNSALFYASVNWDDHFVKSFADRSSAASISDIVLEFDPRIVTRSVYDLGWRPLSWDHDKGLGASYHIFHTAMCSTELCLPLCRLLHHRYQCFNQPVWLQCTREWNGDYQRVLPQFDVETGLYGEDEAETLPYPVGHRLLAVELDSICQTHPLLVDRDNWPVKDILSALMAQSPGNLLIPSIIIRYINDPHQSPAVMLNRALAACASATAGEQAKLDNLYTLILQPPGIDVPLVKSILHMLIGLSSANLEFLEHKFTFFPTLSILAGYLQLPPGTVSATLCRLHSIVDIPTNTAMPVTFYNASLEGYLLSPHRSLHLFQEPYQTRINLTLACTHHLQRWVETPGIVTLCTTFATYTWDKLLAKCLIDELSPNSIELLEPILKFDPRNFWRLQFFVYHSGNAHRPVSKLCETFHLTMCESQPCLPFCRHLWRMDKCYVDVEAIQNSFSFDPWTTIEDRLAALHQFDIETGLYDEAEVEGLPYPEELIQIDNF